EPLVLVVLVVNVAVFMCVVQVPPGSVNDSAYGNVLGLASVYETIPRAPLRVSVSVTLPSSMVGLTVLKSKVAVPEALVCGAPKSTQLAVAVLVPLLALGAAA